MLEIIFNLINFYPHLLLPPFLQLYLFIRLLYLLLLLRKLLPELGLLLLKLEGASSKLLLQLIEINCLNCEVACKRLVGLGAAAWWSGIGGLAFADFV